MAKKVAPKKVTKTVCPECGTKANQHKVAGGYKCEQCRKIHK